MLFLLTRRLTHPLQLVNSFQPSHRATTVPSTESHSTLSPLFRKKSALPVILYLSDLIHVGLGHWTVHSMRPDSVCFHFFIPLHCLVLAESKYLLIGWTLSHPSLSVLSHSPELTLWCSELGVSDMGRRIGFEKAHQSALCCYSKCSSVFLCVMS